MSSLVNRYPSKACPVLLRVDAYAHLRTPESSGSSASIHKGLESRRRGPVWPVEKVAEAGFSLLTRAEPAKHGMASSATIHGSVDPPRVGVLPVRPGSSMYSKPAGRLGLTPVRHAVIFVYLGAYRSGAWRDPATVFSSTGDAQRRFCVLGKLGERRLLPTPLRDWRGIGAARAACFGGWRLYQPVLLLAEQFIPFLRFLDTVGALQVLYRGISGHPGVLPEHLLAGLLQLHGNEIPQPASLPCEGSLLTTTVSPGLTLKELHGEAIVSGSSPQTSRHLSLYVAYCCISVIVIVMGR